MRLPKLDPACVLLAVAGAVVLFFVSGVDPYWSDWGTNHGLWVAKLMDGDVQTFLDNVGPTYVGSLVVRSPIFIATALLGGNEDQAFHAAKAVALLLLAGCAAYLLTRARAAGATFGVLVLMAFVTAGNPIAGTALDYGHAEDIMAALASIGGVLLAGRGRLTAAGVVIGVGIALKQWALLAVLPAAVASPRRHWQVPAIAGPVALLFFLPLLFRSGGGVATLGEGAQVESFGIWRSHQLFWPLGIENTAADAISPRVSPDWFLPVPRMIIVGMSLPLSALWLRHRRAGHGHPHDVLLLLAVLFLGRCVFEPWNIDYYHTPFLLSLAAWEILRRPGLPVLSLAATAATWMSFYTWPWMYSDATYAMYMGWTLVLAWVLVRSLLRPAVTAPAPQRALLAEAA